MHIDIGGLVKSRIANYLDPQYWRRTILHCARLWIPTLVTHFLGNPVVPFCKVQFLESTHYQKKTANITQRISLSKERKFPIDSPHVCVDILQNHVQPKGCASNSPGSRLIVQLPLRRSGGLFAGLLSSERRVDGLRTSMFKEGRGISCNGRPETTYPSAGTLCNTSADQIYYLDSSLKS